MHIIRKLWSWTSSKKNLKSLRKQNITTSIYTIKPYDSIMCGYFCIGFVDFMLEGKILLDYPHLIFFNEN